MTTIGSTTPTDPTTTTTGTGDSLVQTAVGAGAQSIGGLATGLDTNAIIAALVASERALEDPIKNQASLAQVALQSYALIRTNLAALTAATQSLSQPSGWQALLATSSNPNVASVT